MKRILILGGGFAGLWSAVDAARKLDCAGARGVEITLVNRDAYHSVRVRNYECDLHGVRVPLAEILDPIEVKWVEGEIADIDFSNQQVAVVQHDGQRLLPYDRLVFALGSRLVHPEIPGLPEHVFSVDTYNEAVRLNTHLCALPSRPESPERNTILVVGAGLTGIETATEMPLKLRAFLGGTSAGCGVPKPFRVILADRSPHGGSNMGESARPVIEKALAFLGIETRTGVSIASVDSAGVTLDSGEKIPSATVVWCTGMAANPLTSLFPVERDRFGRIPVNEYMKVKGVENVFAAGDAARSMVGDTHASVMSCQHARPMGRFAGCNAVCDLIGEAMLPLRIDWYVTVLDLGAWGALYTQGWDRRVVSEGEAAKKTKYLINRQRIYPPLTGNRREILDAAAPLVQAAPEKYPRSAHANCGHP